MLRPSNSKSIKTTGSSEALAKSLYHCILEEDLNQVIFLLEKKKADPNYLLPQFGITPLHCSVGSGSENFSFKVVSYCLLYGGNPNVQCSEGTTPVILASFWGRADVLKLLLAFGGDPFISDYEGFNSFDYAKKKKNTFVLSCLKNYPLKENPVTLTPKNNGFGVKTQTSSEKYRNVVFKSIESSGSSESDFFSFEENDLHESEALNLNESSFSQNDQTICGEGPQFSDVDSSSKFEQRFVRTDCESDIFSDIDSELNVAVIYSKLNSLLLEEGSGLGNSNNGNLRLTDETHDKAYFTVSGSPQLSHSQEKGDNFQSGSISQSSHNKDILPTCCNNVKKASDVFDGLSDWQEDTNLLNVGFITPKTEIFPKKDDKLSNLPQSKLGTEACANSEDEGSELSEVNSSSYDTDSLRRELADRRIFHGPVTKTTKKVYIRHLNRAVREKITYPDVTHNFCNTLIRTFSDNHNLLLNEWSNLETLMSEDFIKNSGKRKMDGGLSKVFFNYLLLDPEMSRNLPFRCGQMDHLDVWKTFLVSIFYVGKGKHSRPYAHFSEALKQKAGRPPGKKVEKILSIWNKGLGVICIQVFHNITSAEALTREAVMIEALNGLNLTNTLTGSYYGLASTWNMKQKTQLGAVLLSRALGVFLAEGERQIFPHDLR